MKRVAVPKPILKLLFFKKKLPNLLQVQEFYKLLASVLESFYYQPLHANYFMLFKVRILGQHAPRSCCLFG